VAFDLRSHEAVVEHSDGRGRHPLARRYTVGRALGEYLLDWEDVRSSPDPQAFALEFARSAFRHSCAVCDWDPALPASAEGKPPPVS